MLRTLSRSRVLSATVASAVASLTLVAAACLPLTAGAQQAPATSAKAAKAATKFARRAVPELEPRAMELLRAASTALAGAKSLAFTAVVTYESPSSLGPALAYTTQSEVLMQRPDKLRVVTLGDGPASEFYYDGKTMTAYAPAEKLVAVAPAPPTIEGMLKAAFDQTATYFPFGDLLAADPYQGLADKLTTAFYIGQSKVIGGTTTDMIALVSDSVFMQVWIGADDKLPRRMTAVFRGDPLRLRHQLELSNWKLDPVAAADAFAALNAANAKKIAFAVPQPPAAPAKKSKSGKAAPAAKS